MEREDSTNAQSRAEAVFKKYGGYLRASEAFNYGIHPRVLYSLRDEGKIESVSRGLFRLKSMPELSSPALFTLAIKVPSAVICLNSALEFHKLISTKSQGLSVALSKGSDKPRMSGFHFKFYLVSEPAFSEGIQTFHSEGIDLRIYGPEKTIADCFKFRNKIGIDIAIEALNRWWKRENKNINDLMKFARSCRIEKILEPYLQLLESQERRKNI
jgi:predicted transcriptional regulator of viral defense system